MWPFGSSGKGGRRIPASRVMELSSRGVPETQIITTLKSEGYSPGEVDAAMKQAIRGAVGGPSQGMPPSRAPPEPQDPYGSGGPPEPPGLGPPEPRYSQSPSPPGPAEPYREPGPTESPGMPSYGRAPPGMGMPPQASRQDDPMGMPPPNVSGLGMPPLPGEPGFDPERDLSPPDSPEEEEPIPAFRERSTRRERTEDRRRAIEEMVEGIVDERWTQLSQELEAIRSEFSQIQGKIEVLEGSLKKTEKEKDTGFGDIKDKIDNYRSSMGEISSRMGAVEDAMKNTMTPMMQTMRSLTDAVKELKNQRTGSSDLPEPPAERPRKRPARTSEADDPGYGGFDDEGPESDLEKRS